MVRIRVCVRILGPGLWAFICLDLLNRGDGPKAMVPTTTSISGNEVTLFCDQEDCYHEANQDVGWVWTQ